MGFAKSHLRLRWIFSLSKLQLVWVNKWNGKIMKTALSLFYPALFRIHLDCVIIKKEKKKGRSNTTQRIDLILSFLGKQPEIFLSGWLQVMVFDATVSRSPRPVRCPTAALLVTGRCHCPTALPACQPASQPHACLLPHWWSSEAAWLTDRVTHQPPNGFSKNTAQHPRELY